MVFKPQSAAVEGAVNAWANRHRSAGDFRCATCCIPIALWRHTWPSCGHELCQPHHSLAQSLRARTRGRRRISRALGGGRRGGGDRGRGRVQPLPQDVWLIHKEGALAGERAVDDPEAAPRARTWRNCRGTCRRTVLKPSRLRQAKRRDGAAGRRWPTWGAVWPLGDGDGAADRFRRPRLRPGPA